MSSMPVNLNIRCNKGQFRFSVHWNKFEQNDFEQNLATKKGLYGIVTSDMMILSKKLFSF